VNQTNVDVVCDFYYIGVWQIVSGSDLGSDVLNLGLLCQKPLKVQVVIVRDITGKPDLIGWSVVFHPQILRSCAALVRPMAIHPEHRCIRVL